MPLAPEAEPKPYGYRRTASRSAEARQSEASFAIVVSSAPDFCQGATAGVAQAVRPSTSISLKDARIRMLFGIATLRERKFEAERIVLVLIS